MPCDGTVALQLQQDMPWHGMHAMACGVACHGMPCGLRSAMPKKGEPPGE